VRFLEALEFEDLVVLLNTVGDEASRAAYREALKEYLEPHRETLADDSRRRLETNPLRILDTKVPRELELLEGAPSLADHLSDESRQHFDAVRTALERFEIDYRVEDRLVRGLDYYARTVFEIVSEGLGAQDAIVGGGRYDGLIAELGGPDVPAIGFAIGEDRLIEVLPETFRGKVAARPPVLVVPVGEVATLEALALAERLRRRGIGAASENAGRSLRSALKRADRAGVKHVVLLGDEELAAGEATLRDLAAGEQERMSLEELLTRLEEVE
jgi:histidyl-tRNA synthetase